MMKNLGYLVLFVVAYAALGQDEFGFARRAGPFSFGDDSAVPSPEDPDGDGVVGAAGKDYPVLRVAPPSSFTCAGKIPGMYADMETGCQVYHVCQADSRKDSRLCVNGTVFSQATFSCDWWYNVDCRSSEAFYSLNADLGKEPANAHHRKGNIGFPGEPNALKKPPHMQIPILPPPPPPPSFPSEGLLDLPRRIPNFSERPRPQIDFEIPPPPRDRLLKKLRPPPQFVDDLRQRIPEPPKPGFVVEIPQFPRPSPIIVEDRPREPRPKLFDGPEEDVRRPRPKSFDGREDDIHRPRPKPFDGHEDDIRRPRPKPFDGQQEERRPRPKPFDGQEENRRPGPRPFIEQVEDIRRPSRPRPKQEGPLGRKPRPGGDRHYGRNNAFDPAIHLPRPRPNSEKKFTKIPALKPDRSPMMLPVKSSDTVSGYSDLYLGKPVDED